MCSVFIDVKAGGVGHPRNPPLIKMYSQHNEFYHPKLSVRRHWLQDSDKSPD